MARPSFWGLGIYLDEHEDEVRVRRGGPDRSAPPYRPRHYVNNDPWYDAREGDVPGSITASPREGTYLGKEEIEEYLRDTAAWIKRGEDRRWVLGEPEANLRNF